MKLFVLFYYFETIKHKINDWIIITSVTFCNITIQSDICHNQDSLKSVKVKMESLKSNKSNPRLKQVEEPLLIKAELTKYFLLKKLKVFCFIWGKNSFTLVSLISDFEFIVMIFTVAVSPLLLWYLL